MERVDGIGGFFFRSKDPQALGRWYDDLEAMVEQLRAAGVGVEVDPETYPNGRFAQTEDPEGNRIQLWEPSPAQTPSVPTPAADVD